MARGTVEARGSGRRRDPARSRGPGSPVLDGEGVVPLRRELSAHWRVTFDAAA
jgi:hypothetical protein